MRARFIRVPSLRCSLSGGGWGGVLRRRNTIRLFIKAVPVAHTKEAPAAAEGMGWGVGGDGWKEGTGMKVGVREIMLNALFCPSSLSLR